MRSTLKPISIVLVWLVLFSAVGCSALGGSSPTALQASGSIEATEVAVAPELSGRLVEIKVSEGDSVQAGDVLFSLDGSLLQAQRLSAAAALAAAQANVQTAQFGLDAAKSAVTAAETALELAKANSQAELLSAQQALDQLNENAALARAAAESDVAAASRAVREATYQLDNFTIPNEQAGLTSMEALDLMKSRLDSARQAFEPYRNASSSDSTRQDLKKKLDEAQSNYDAAVRRMEYETQVALAQARLDKALLDLEKVKDGPNPDDVAVLNARITAIQDTPLQAQAALDQAKVGVEQAQSVLDGAGKAVEGAQAQIDAIDAQIEKLTVRAPIAGVVLTRSVQPGEVLQAGMTALTLARLDQLTVTVYLPEDRYGQISLGDPASLAVDSFPGQSFAAKVTRIADQAEYTPRNVQTQEGRQTTVYAVELTIANPEGKLKPGMPVDVTF
jgi:HlyD family secretion protein